jgi:glycosyltransferase involved in cell wall biosynthesis
MRASVVVPTYRRPDLLDRCLGALAAQEFDPSDFEVIVADDAASEAAREQVEGWTARAPMPVRYLSVTRAHGPAAARNEGWRSARGAIIAFTDDDCIPDPRWLVEGVRAFSEGIDAASGRVVVPLPDDPTDYERDAAGLEGAEFVTANCFCRREALGAVGGFDERFRAAWREDSDLQFTLLERGSRIAKAPGAIVVHPVRPSSWGVSVRQQRKSLFDALLYKKHPGLYRARIRPSPPWDYYAIAASLAAAVIAGASGHARAAIVAASAWLVLTAAFCLKRLRTTSRAPAHVAEMVATSALIPPLSISWRLYGAWKYRVLFL